MPSAQALLLTKEKQALLMLSVACLGLDQAVKAWIQQSMGLSTSVPVWPGIFHITYVHNTGAAFSLLEQYPALLLAMTLFLFSVLLLFCLSRTVLSKTEWFSYALVLGGAAGNIADRLRLGYVLDYLDFRVIQYPIFNLADSFIFIGVFLLILTQFQKRPMPSR